MNFGWTTEIVIAARIDFSKEEYKQRTMKYEREEKTGSSYMLYEVALVVYCGRTDVV